MLRITSKSTRYITNSMKSVTFIRTYLVNASFFLISLFPCSFRKITNPKFIQFWRSLYDIDGFSSDLMGCDMNSMDYNMLSYERSNMNTKVHTDMTTNVRIRMTRSVWIYMSTRVVLCISMHKLSWTDISWPTRRVALTPSWPSWAADQLIWPNPCQVDQLDQLIWFHFDQIDQPDQMILPHLCQVDQPNQLIWFHLDQIDQPDQLIWSRFGQADQPDPLIWPHFGQVDKPDQLIWVKVNLEPKLLQTVSNLF